MTRDEAIAKVLAVVGSGRPRTTVENDVDTLITLGLLKVDEVKKTTARDLAIIAVNRVIERPWHLRVELAKDIVDEIEKAGISLRIGFPK